MFGIDFPLWAAKLLFNNTDILFKTYMNIHANPMLGGFMGSTKMSFILKPLWIAAIASGNALGKIYKREDDDKGTLSFSDKILNDMNESAGKVANEVKGRLLEGHATQQEIDTSQKYVDAISREFQELDELNSLIEMQLGND